MNSKPTLIILIPGFPKDEQDMVCLPAQQDVVLQVNKQFPGTKLLIFAFQYPFEKGAYYWHGNKVTAFGGQNKGGPARRWLWYKINRQLNKCKKENNIMGVLSFWAGECAYTGQRWAAKNNIQHYAWVMGQDAKKDNKYIRKAGLPGKNLVAISDFSAGELKRNHGLDPVAVIPLGITPPIVLTDQKREIDLIAAGSLIPLKQYHVCIDIVLELKKDFPGIRMLICGMGPEKQRLEELINRNGLNENLQLPGNIDHPELLTLLQKSKIFLHPSSYEGLGIACLEALAAGLPVVSFRFPMKEPISKWYVVDSNDAMIRKSLSLLKEPVDHEPVHPFTTKDTARMIMRLFDHQ